MGMSASQARLLALTARQSNLEYEGQQINQQRTNLSNQSANYYNSLLTMTVPTPPSTDNYTTVKYSFVIGGNDATISRVLPENDNKGYLVTYTTNLTIVGIQENAAYKVAANNTTSKTGISTSIAKTDSYDGESDYYVNTCIKDHQKGEYVILNNPNDERITSSNETKFFDKNGYEVEKDIAVKDGKLNDGYFALGKYKESDKDAEKYSLSNVKLTSQDEFDKAKVGGKVIKFTEDKDATGTIDIITATNGETFGSVSAEYKEAFENSNLDPSEYYQYKSSTGTRFVKKEDLSLNNQGNKSVMTLAAASLIKTQATELSGVQVEFDATGRISSMTDQNGNTYTMTTSTVTDDEAYEDAYNQYTYDQYVYDQKQNEINAHIEILQAQDKNLELRLSQLNTEHSAIQTEMEAVQKVLSKNIDNSFKTFNA